MHRQGLSIVVFVSILLAALVASAQTVDVAANTVRIKIGESYGSGAYLGNQFVLSCAHLFEGENTSAGEVWFRNGQRYSATVAGLDRTWDQSLLKLSSLPPHTGLAISTTNPKPGDVVYAFGYGQGNKIQRTSGRVTKYVDNGRGPADWFQATGRVNQGTSGGPMVDANGRVIGNVWGTDGTHMVGLVTGRTKLFLRKRGLFNRGASSGGQCCPGGTCPPIEYQIRSPAPNLIPMPDTTAPPIIYPTPPDIVAPEVSVTPEVDYQEIVNRLKQDTEFMAAARGPEGPAGPAGVQGLAGLPGPPGPAGQDATLTEQQVASMATTIINALKTDQDFIAATTGPKGDPGEPGTPAEVLPVDTEWSHMVLIAPKNADYWPRLNSEFERAATHYSTMRHIEPPEDRNIGPMPVLVAYSSGKPARSWIGLRNVSQALTQITRGDFDEFTSPSLAMIGK